MIFCEHCFNDSIIGTTIRAVSNDRGQCPICNRKNVYLYDTEMHSDLTDIVEPLLSIYTSEKDLSDQYPESEKKLLSTELIERWNLFSNVSSENMIKILISICPNVYKSNPDIFMKRVGIPDIFDDSILKGSSLVQGNSWDEFVDEIKTKNRYHSNMINLKVLEKYCSHIRKVYKKGSTFYRARISDDPNGFLTNQMSAPPPGKSSEGRANAKGIVCLYLANDVDTVLHEVRSAAYDYVSVGKFILNKDIIVVDLKNINKISPFMETLGFLDHAINSEYLNRLNLEMSKPLRRSDSTIDYVPTQYFSDFIRSLKHDQKHEYDGIEYKSAANPGGFNLAIFEPKLFECESVEVYEIEKLNYDRRLIKATV